MTTVVLEIRSLAATLADAGADSEVRIAFATPELLGQILTAKRWHLLNPIT